MEEIWDQETRTDNEAAHHWSAAVTNLVVRSSIHISLLKRRCGEWKAKWWWWWIPSFDIDSNAEGSLAMMCLSLGWLVSTTFVCVLCVTSYDYLNWLTCHFHCRCTDADHPQRLLCRFGKAVRYYFQEVTYYFIFFFSLFLKAIQVSRACHGV